MVSPAWVVTAAKSIATTGWKLVRRRGRRPERAARTSLIVACVAAAPAVQAQEPSPLARVEALALDTATVGRVTAHFAPGDRQRAAQLAVLAEEAAAFFEREIGLSFRFRLAVLSPEHWFSDIEGGPYTIPWYSPAEAMIVVPSSDEGLPTGSSFTRAVDFIALHEYGHLAAKRYFHPGSGRDWGPVHWFEELLATYFAYSFVASWDPPWAEAMRSEWAANVAGFTPRERSLDWRFMRSLPPDEIGPTYGWYQNLLNLRAAEIHDGHGVAFLPALTEGLPWTDLASWEIGSLLPHLEAVSPGFEAWADRLESGTELPGSGAMTVCSSGPAPVIAVIAATMGCAAAHDRLPPIELTEANDNRSPAADLAITGATVIDGTGDAPRTGTTILVRDGRIVAVAPDDRAAVPAGATVIDATGKYVIPGLVDLHAHGTTDAALTQYLFYGVTSVLQIGGTGANTEAIRDLRERRAAGTLEAPYIYGTGGHLTLHGTHPIYTLFPPSIREAADSIAATTPLEEPANLYPLGIGVSFVRTVEAAHKAVQERAAGGMDAIKITVESGPRFFGEHRPRMTEEMIRAIVDEAAPHGLPVFAHISSVPELEAAVRGGASTLAHAVGDEPEPGPEHVRMLAEGGVSVTPTLAFFYALHRYVDDPTLLDDPFLRAGVTEEDIESA